MAIIGRIQSFEVDEQGRRLVVVDTVAGDTLTVNYLTPLGEDSQPLAGDWVQLVENQGTGRRSAVAYIDQTNAPTAAAGEKIIYSRTPDGQIVAAVDLLNTGEVAIHNDIAHVTVRPSGEIEVRNGSGGMTLGTDGTLNLNGVTISPSGGIVAPSSLVLNGREIHNHNHLAGTPPGTTGPNNP